jgi:hypothetical protein
VTECLELIGSSNARLYRPVGLQSIPKDIVRTKKYAFFFFFVFFFRFLMLLLFWEKMFLKFRLRQNKRKIGLVIC